MEKSVLLVEDSKTYAQALIDKIRDETGFDTVCFQTLAAAQQDLALNKARYFIALLDFNLPDSHNGDLIDLCIRAGIPAVVMTGDLSDDIQELVWTKNVVDYIIKEGPHTLEYLARTVARIARNPEISILIADDSPTARRHLREILELHRYRILEASSGIEALTKLKENPDIKLVLIDHTMPDIDGFELTSEMRRMRPLDSLGIIGMSADGSHRLLVKFIKYGANDFISKPFLREQLLCRVTQNISTIEQFETIRSISFTDFLTGLRNRRYFFEFAPFMMKNAVREKTNPVVAMIDIDFFKKTNDTYGHKAGDLVLKAVADLILTSFRETDIVARVGGEEFCVIWIPNIPV
ncbi:MAG: diguanylate cyclase [Spirochaetota bacterium]